MILECNCKHEGQDKIHGKNNRVFNKTVTRKDSPDEYRCTVCLKERILKEGHNTK